MNRILSRMTSGLLLLCLVATANGQNLSIKGGVDWACGPYGGVVPFKVTVKTANGAPVKNDLKLNVCLASSNYYNQRIISREFAIRAGSTTGGTTLLIPLTSNANEYYRWWVERDFNNRYNSRDLVIQSFNQSQSGNEFVDSYLFINSAVTQSSELASVVVAPRTRPAYATAKPAVVDASKMPNASTLYELYTGDNSMNRASALGIQSGISSFKSIPPIQMPENWVEYSAINHIVIPLPDLKSIEQSNPEKITALKEWTAAGGRLIISHCTPGFPEINAVARSLNAKSTQTDYRWLNSEKVASVSKDTTIVDSYAARGTTFQSGAVVRQQGTFDYWSFREQETPNWTTASDGWLGLNQGESFSNETKLITSNFGQGQIVLVADDMTNWRVADWRKLSVIMGTARHSLMANLGESPAELEESEYVKIPGVNPPPKSAFQVLIILFVVIVGPVSYFFLKHTKRLNLLLVTAPIISLITCFALFAYGILAEGFGVKVRHDSYTFLDQRQDIAVTRSRYFVYSGTHPKKHQFELDKLVQISKSDRLQDKSFTRIDDNGLSYSGGLIQARTPHQLVVTDPYSTKAGIRIRQQGDSYQVISDFSTEIRKLAIKINNKFFFVEDVPPNSFVDLQPSKIEFATADINTYLYGDGMLSRALLSRGTWGVMNRNVHNFSLGRLDDNKHYFAIFDEYEATAPIRESVSKSAGVHVVEGVW